MDSAGFTCDLLRITGRTSPSICLPKRVTMPEIVPESVSETVAETVPQTIAGTTLDLTTIARAAEHGLAEANVSVEAAILSAMNAMPATASEFDRGMAAGLVLARHAAGNADGDAAATDGDERVAAWPKYASR